MDKWETQVVTDDGDTVCIMFTNPSGMMGLDRLTDQDLLEIADTIYEHLNRQGVGETHRHMRRLLEEARTRLIPGPSGDLDERIERVLGINLGLDAKPLPEDTGFEN